MDMAVANLFKHKIRFELIDKEIDRVEPSIFMRGQYYKSQDIENVKSLGLNDVNDLCTIHCKPLVLFALSKVIHEDHVIPIDWVTIIVGVKGYQRGDFDGLIRYHFNNPLDSPELFFTHPSIDSLPFPERLLNESIYVFVHVRCYYSCHFLREEARFRLEFNYRRYWRHRFPIEDCLTDVSSDEENYDSESADEDYSQDSYGDTDYENKDEDEYTPPTETYREDHCVVCLETKPNILYVDCMHIAICDSCDRLKKTGRKQCDVCRADIYERIKI